jgi:hypothetical protein
MDEQLRALGNALQALDDMEAILRVRTHEASLAFHIACTELQQSQGAGTGEQDVCINTVVDASLRRTI